MRQLSKKARNADEDLEVLTLMGYENQEDFTNKTRLWAVSFKLIRDKYPALRTMDKKSYGELIAKATFLLRKELPYVIYPNHYKVASIYSASDWLRIKESKLRTREAEDGSCQAMWDLQVCYRQSDALFNSYSGLLDLYTTNCENGSFVQCQAMWELEARRDEEYGQGLDDCTAVYDGCQ